jgi:hypothetical protein
MNLFNGPIKMKLLKRKKPTLQNWIFLELIKRKLNISNLLYTKKKNHGDQHPQFKVVVALMLNYLGFHPV